MSISSLTQRRLFVWLVAGSEAEMKKLRQAVFEDRLKIALRPFMNRCALCY